LAEIGTKADYAIHRKRHRRQASLNGDQSNQRAWAKAC
jgi:hypothetical protein